MNGPEHTDDWVFDLSGDPERPKLANDGELVSLIGEPERWQQYENETVYELDCLVRDWIAVMCKRSKWKSHYMCRRYTMKMVYEQIYGKKYDSSEPGIGKINIWLPRILRHYSSRVQKNGSIYGKFHSKTIYTISPKRLDKPPYSLRLRLEWFAEKGIMPTYTNMCMPKDSLKAGHARNPRTDENMRLRRERGRARYNERYADRDR